MKRILSFTVLILFAILQLQAQKLSYDVAFIPKELTVHANAVIRNETFNIDIQKADEVWITHKKVITILNPNGKYFGAIRVYYNKKRPVRSLSAALYNANGQLVQNFKKRDFEDVSTLQDFSLFEDERKKRLFPSALEYPYTVVYEYRQKYQFTLYLPKWIPVISDGVAVQKSSYSITSPGDIPVHYYMQGLPKPVIDSTDKGIVYTWTLQNKQAMQKEPYSPPLFKSGIPIVMVSPMRFKYYGMKGGFSNWREYGQWAYDHLLKDHDQLSESTINKVRQLTRGLSSPEEKARKLYAFAQKRNRYVSIQIGKGGFEPMKALEVDKVGYGDCKALVNYTLALLKAAGIVSFYTEVWGGENKIGLRPDFASAGQGNHIILCVPFKKDTTWLECTDKLMPFGYLGSFTDNRNVLICTPQGGIYTHTPKYADSLNIQDRVARFVIDSMGNLKGQMTTTFEGLLYERRQSFETLSYADKIKRVKSAYSFLQMDLSEYDLIFMKQKNPEVKERSSFISPRYAAVNDRGLIIPLNPVNRFTNIPEKIKNRRNEVYISRGFIMKDSFSYTFPEGYGVSFLPKNADIHSLFGSYTTSIKLQGKKLVYNRNFKLRSGYYSPDSYQELIRFLEQVAGYDRQKCIIGKIE